MAELVEGKLEILPMPTWKHPLIVKYLTAAVETYVTQYGLGGVTLFAPLPAPLFPGTIREPDVLYVRPQNVPTNPSGYPSQLDLVMEVVSEGTEVRQRDYVDKRADYARAGITEYWIVDPELVRVTVLSLTEGAYQVHCERGAGETARSAMFADFVIEVDNVFRTS